MAKILAFTYGIACIILVAIVERLGAILQLSLSVFGVIGGPILGVFVLGIFFPWANVKGAVSGLVSGLVVVFWIAIGAFLNKPPKHFAPVSVEGCQDLYFNMTGNVWNGTAGFQTMAKKDDIFVIYRLSYMWYSAIGCLWVAIIGLSISFLTGAHSKDDVKQDLISPLTRKALALFSKVRHNKSVFPVEMASKNIKSTTNLKPENVGKTGHQDGVINIAYLSDSATPSMPKSTRTGSSIHAANM